MTTRNSPIINPGVLTGNINPNDKSKFNVMSQPFVLKRLREIESFDGNSKDLTTFIREIENTAPFVALYDDISQRIINDSIKFHRKSSRNN